VALYRVPNFMRYRGCLLCVDRQDRELTRMISFRQSDRIGRTSWYSVVLTFSTPVPSRILLVSDTPRSSTSKHPANPVIFHVLTHLLSSANPRLLPFSRSSPQMRASHPYRRFPLTVSPFLAFSEKCYRSPLCSAGYSILGHCFSRSSLHAVHLAG
jgi:hypothetical protein